MIFSVAVAAALFFASVSIADTFEKVYLDKLRSFTGNTDISVSVKENAAIPYINIHDLDDINNFIDYKASMLFGKGVYKNSENNLINFSLYGYDYDELMRISPLLFNKKDNVVPFRGKKIIISKDVSTKYNICLNDRIKLNINGISEMFTVCGIGERSGLFKNENQSVIGIVPIEVLSSLYDEKGKASNAYIKLKNINDKEAIIKKLSDKYKNYDVRESVDENTLKQEVNSARTPFLMMLIMVIIMSVFIIFTGFKVITLERLPYIGAFRSIGATKKITTCLLLIESIIYGVIGGVAGDCFGIAVLYVMADRANEYKALGVKTVISFEPWQLLCAFILAVFISFISSLFPILKTSKISIKDIVLNNIEKTNINRKYKLVLGIVFILIGAVLPYVVSKKIVVIAAIISIIIAIIGIIIIIPHITGFFVLIFENIYAKIFGNEGILAVKNLRNNKSIINNISLLTIGVSSIFMISTISFSFSKVLTSAYNLYNFDIFFSVDNGNKVTEQRLLKLDGIKAARGFYAAWDLKVDGNSDPIMETDGVDNGQFLQYLNVNLDGDADKILKNFDKDRNVIVTNFLKEKLNLKKGDYITFKMKNKSINYKVAGFFESSMQNGSIAFVPERFLKLDTGNKYYDHFAVKTSGNIEDVKQNIKKEFIKEPIFMKSVNEFKKQNADDFSKLISMLNWFSMISIVMGTFGIINNFIISFIERKHSLAIMSSIGMNKTQRIKMLVVEALTIGIIGGICGTFMGMLISNAVPIGVKAMGMPFKVYFSWKIYTFCILSAVLVTLIASVGSQIKASNINIVNEIKYE